MASVDEKTLWSNYADKLLELDLKKEISRSLDQRIKQRTSDFLEETKKLEALHTDMWTSIDTFCDSAWKFSSDHNFADIIDNYLSTSMSDSATNVMKIQEGNEEQIQYLNYQIKILNEDIQKLEKTLQDLSIESKHGEEKLPLQLLQKSNVQANEKKVIFSNEKSISKNTNCDKFINNDEVMLKTKDDQKLLRSILKAPQNQNRQMKSKKSTFSVKKKTNICEKYEKGLLNPQIYTSY